MAYEQPLNLNEFFMSRNEIANRHGGRLELQAMSRVREHMVEEDSKKPQQGSGQDAQVAQALPLLNKNKMETKTKGEIDV